MIHTLQDLSRHADETMTADRQGFDISDCNTLLAMLFVQGQHILKIKMQRK